MTLSSEKFSDEQFAAKVDWEGGVYDALCEYGLSAQNLENEDGDLFKLVSEFDKVKGPFLQMLNDIEEVLEDIGE
jgi:hypothetical protein